MAQPTQPRRRFAPIPFETTYERYRKTIPTSEPTPDPSPRETPSPSPPPSPRVASRETQTPNKEKRRFAPQLVESTRRSRRAGDVGPATKPVDKTDITPHTNHIYSVKSRKKHNRHPGHARRESCDDEISDHVFDLNRRDAEKKLEEIALSAFPNAGARAGGAEHFVVREGSDDDSDISRGRTMIRGPGDKKPSRRNSSEVGWAVKEMQEFSEALAKARGDTMIDSDYGSGSMLSLPDDAMSLTRARPSLGGPLSPIGEHPMPYIPSEPVSSDRRDIESSSYFPPLAQTRSESPPARVIGESFMPYIPSAPPGRAADMAFDGPAPPMPFVSASQIPADTGFRSRPLGGYGGGYGNQEEKMDRDLWRLRNRASPPMLGKEIVFRMCPSPKQTKLEPDQKWDKEIGATVEANRDTTGQFGLWRGYCYTTNSQEALVPAERPAMITTPMPPATPHEHSEPFPGANSYLAPYTLYEEPTPTGAQSAVAPSTSEHRSRAGEPKGLHMLMGLDERLRKEKASADLEERIAAEFDDAFVTQVYNYLSLGYPAMARAYDEELAKISRIGVGELERDDDEVMDQIGSRAKGHLKLEMDADTPDEERCPRWKALKRYIFEWARQHPDLDSISPLAWGVSERRGSWGI
ncbi:hypothetical protein NKR23_g4314 [Pleurostoma richardsiae]|uniref:Uncharacterized protein n=1 Tax=Pleurostoma richardsiae TaxID=41990 RepID=A0AA38RVL0_9PEZI|nr:hypothetical protein NKR23_g4314 [Pleurostoma richardsiae]